MRKWAKQVGIRPGDLVLIAAVSAVAACGGASAASDSGTGNEASSEAGGTQAQTEADLAFIAAVCDAVKPCCATNHQTWNVAMCKQSFGRMAQSRDPQVRQACLAELGRLATSPTCMPDIVDFNNPCARLLNEPGGSRAPGEACRSTAECAGSASTLTLCMESTCISYAVGAEGDYPCLGNKLTNGFMDVIPWKTGSTTPESHAFICPKRAGLFCDLGDNKCKPIQPGGAACTLPDGCDSRDCRSDGTCRPLLIPGEECAVDCAGDYYCDRTVCKPKLAAGAACDGTHTDQCVGDCGGSNLCSGLCQDGICSPLNLAESSMLDVLCGTVIFNG